jgi:hypothetical protein
LLRKTEVGRLDVEGRGMLGNGKLYALYCSSNNIGIYGMIQEERLVFWNVVVSVIVEEKSHTKMCLILNGNRDRAV